MSLIPHLLVGCNFLSAILFALAAAI